MSEADPTAARARAVARDALDELRERLPELQPVTNTARVGQVLSVADGVATATSMHRPFAGELVDVGGVLAVAEDLQEGRTRLVLLSEAHGVEAGTPRAAWDDWWRSRPGSS